MTSQYSDPYEEWKAQGRPGGSYAAWQASQGGQAAPQVTGGSVASPAATPAGAFNQAWMNEGLAAYNAGQRGSDPLRTPGFDPNTFRQTYGAAQGGNRPEDLARFSNETLAGWMPFYDPGTGKYRSMRGADGWFDKPTECPPGTGPSGPNETDPCTANGYGNQQAASNPLQNVMSSLQGTPASAKVGGALTNSTTGSGGIYGGAMGGQGATQDKVAAPLSTPSGGLYGGYAGGQNLPTPTTPTGPVQSSLTSLLAPMQGFVAPTTAQSGLTNMLKSQQKRPGQWF
jgi:hypothetical protein